MKTNDSIVVYIVFSFFTIGSTENISCLNNKKFHNEVLSKDDEYYSARNIICDGNKSRSWCIPYDYNNEVEPWKYRELTNYSLPWKYEYTFEILDVREVNDNTQMITIGMYFYVGWHEPRLQINSKTKEWSTSDMISISPLNLKYFWYPDIDIYGMKQFSPMKNIKQLSSLNLMKTKTIHYDLRVDVSYSCKMDFNDYPFDVHECPFRVSSYYSSKETVACTSVYEADKGSDRIPQYWITIEKLPSRLNTTMYFETEYATCGFNLVLVRSKRQIFFQVYLTTTLLVIVSWVSFAIQPDIVPGRMGLLVTIFLVLINIFTGVKNTAPPSSNLNASDVFLFLCIAQVFAALIQYAAILILKSFKVESAHISCQSFTDHNSTNTQNSFIHRKDRKKDDNYSLSTVDVVSLIIFPTFFVVCNIIYYNIYVNN